MPLRELDGRASDYKAYQAQAKVERDIQKRNEDNGFAGNSGEDTCRKLIAERRPDEHQH